MTEGYYYCLNCHSEITPDYNEHCCFCGTYAIAVPGDYTNEEVERAFDLLNREQQGLIITPPCKVGETIYFIDKDTNEIEEDKVKFFTVTKDGVMPILKWHNRKCWEFYKWGKNVFVNIEEAKKVLKDNKR